MSPDEFQQAWQAHEARTRVTVDADTLLEAVQQGERNFRALILLRDFREAGVSAMMIPLWFIMGALFSLPWTWYLTVLALVWVIGFIVVDRMWQHRKPEVPGEPLLDGVKQSLIQVEHQIWLLRNVAWWYLLPFTISLLTFFVHTAWLSTGNWLAAPFVATPVSAFVLVLYAWVYRLNQVAIGKNLEPRRQELLGLLASLSDETSSEVSGDYTILMGADHVPCSRRRMVI